MGKEKASKEALLKGAQLCESKAVEVQREALSLLKQANALEREALDLMTQAKKFRDEAAKAE